MLERKFFATKEELEEVYRETQSMLKTAKHFGVSKKLIMNYMNKYGLERRPWKVSDHADTIKHLAELKWTAQEIADKVGHFAETVRRYARENDITIHDPYHPGFITTDSGYILLRRPNHPNADSKGYVREHILVMEAHIGRYLVDGEVVHHIDRDKSNNDLDNLQLMTRSEHSSYHFHCGDSNRWLHRNKI
jgi:hypothetical protein